MGKWYEAAKKQREVMDNAGAMLTDAQAVECKSLYRQWAELIGVTVDISGFKFLHGEVLYKLIGAVPHTFSAEWEPGVGTESIYARIDESHAGTPDDPIPYEGNMELEEGKYYSQNGKVYYCFRSTGIPVYSALADLVGLYVEVA